MAKHTISSALRRIAELKGDISRYKTQANSSASWQNEQKPAFSFEEVKSKLDSAKAELVGLKGRVALANCRADAGNKTLQELVFELSEVKDDITFVEGLTAGAQKEITTERREMDYDYEINKSVARTVKTVNHYIFDEKSKEQELDRLRAKASELNQMLERYNHTTDC